MVKALFSLLVAGSLSLVACNDPYNSSEARSPLVMTAR